MSTEALGIGLTLVTLAASIIWGASRIKSSVDTHGNAIGEHKRKLDAHAQAIQDHHGRISRIEGRQGH